MTWFDRWPRPGEAVREAFDAGREVFDVAEELLRLASELPDSAETQRQGIKDAAVHLGRIGSRIGKTNEQLVTSIRRARG